MNTFSHPVYASGRQTPNLPPRGSGGSGRGSGRSTPRGFGFGGMRGNNREKPHSGMSLARMLDLDRPFLKPVHFVRAQETPFLFQNEEEILEVVQVKGMLRNILCLRKLLITFM